MFGEASCGARRGAWHVFGLMDAMGSIVVGGFVHGSPLGRYMSSDEHAESFRAQWEYRTSSA